MENSVVDINIKVIDNATKQINGVSAALKSVGGTAGGLGSQMSSITGLIGGGWTAVAAVVLNVVVGAYKILFDVWKTVFETAIKIVENVIGVLESLATKAIQVAGVIGGVLLAAFSGVAYEAVKMAGNFEQSTMAFTTMLGSAKEAGVFLKQLQDFAAKTPFQFTDLVPATQKLMAFGFATKEIIPTLTGIGDAVSGLGGGTDVLNRVIMVFGRIKASGKVTAREMFELSSAGINGYQMIADKMGITMQEAMKRGERGAIDATFAINALVSGMEKKFPNMMDVQSKTLQGSFSNLKDKLDEALISMGTPIVKALTPIVQGVTAMLTKLVDTGVFVKIGNIIASWFSVENMTKVANFFGNIYNIGALAVDWLQSKWVTFLDWLNNGGVKAFEDFAVNLVDYLAQALPKVLYALQLLARALVGATLIMLNPLNVKKNAEMAGGVLGSAIALAESGMPQWGSNSTEASKTARKTIEDAKALFKPSTLGDDFAKAMKDAMQPIESANKMTADNTSQIASNTNPSELNGKLYGGGEQSKLFGQRFLFGGAAAPVRIQLDIKGGDERDRRIAQAAAEAVLQQISGRKSSRQPVWTGQGVNGTSL